MTTPDPKLLERALRWLARREYARSQLREKLIRLGGHPERIESVLDHLSAIGAQSDRRFTEEYVRSKVGRGFGPLKIGHALEAHGIAHELIVAELGRPDAAWIPVAERVRARHFGMDRPVDAATRERQSRFLLQRGFTPPVVAGLWQGWGHDVLTGDGDPVA